MQILQNKTKKHMPLFKHHIAFKQIDPLGGGLREEIAQEQTEQDSITLEEFVDEGKLSNYWQSVESDIEKDPEWFKFTEDE
jgi:hypothetical protein